MKASVELDNVRYEVAFDDGKLLVDGQAMAAESGAVRVQGRNVLENESPAAFQIRSLSGVAGAPVVAGADGVIRPPMTGTVVEYLVKSGDEVEEGAVVAVLEAMKMRNKIRTPVAGVVEALEAKLGTSVTAADVLLRITPAKR